jgi:transcriptional regulator with XRE-family HTH domain
MSLGARLKEKRRLGFRQAEFASLAGTDVPKQSLYENDHRHLRAPYLASLEPIGVDLLYMLTGQRSPGALGAEASAFLAAYLGLPDELREPVGQLLRNLAENLEQRSRPGGG